MLCPARALLLVSAALLAVCVCAAQLDRCTTITRGSCQGIRIDPPLITLDTDVEYATVIIRDRCQARDKILVSQEVTVCDGAGDSAPILQLSHLFLLFVTRSGLLDSRATVNVTQYCL